MSSIDSFAAAFEGLRQSHETGRLAHAYLLQGSPEGNALALAESFLQLLFCRGAARPCGSCAECVNVKKHAHPDIFWLEPESKSRRIVIGDKDKDQIGIRDLNRFIAVSPLVGAWKVGVILHADRMTEQAANAFLKTLEEPQGASILLLLTDAAQHLLPTIVSRCQRVLLSAGPPAEEEMWREPVLEVLRRGVTGDVLEGLFQAGRLKAVLDAVRKVVTEEEEGRVRPGEPEEKEREKEAREARIAARAAGVRLSILRCMLEWRRDVLLVVLNAEANALYFPEEAEAIRRQAAGLNYAGAMRQVQAVDTMVRLLERNLPEEAVFEAGLRATPA
ncbi:MAG: hypothetical protein V1873_05150 [Verrucomicrobiota bacterium]